MFEREEKRLLDRIDPDLQIVLEKTGSFIAGGAITSIFSNNDINDFDIYVRDLESAVAIIAWCMGKEDYTHADCSEFSGVVSSFTDRSITFSCEGDCFQVILFDFFETAEEIFDKFDFTCCMGAYSFGDKEFVFHDNFLIHVAQRQLVFNSGTSFPLVSALRVQKYKDKGYSISKAEFIRVVLACTKLDVNNWKEFASHCGGLYGTVDDSVFDTEKEFSIDEAMRQLSSIYTIRNKSVVETASGCVDFRDIVTKLHGDRPQLEEPEEPEDRFREGYYYKSVAPTEKEGVFSSFYDRNFLYKVGSVVDGGKKGIFCALMPENEKGYYYNTRYLCEIEHLGGKDDISSSYDKAVLKGNCRVVRVFESNFDFDPILSQYLIEEVFIDE